MEAVEVVGAGCDQPRIGILHVPGKLDLVVGTGLADEQSEAIVRRSRLAIDREFATQGDRRWIRGGARSRCRERRAGYVDVEHRRPRRRYDNARLEGVKAVHRAIESQVVGSGDDADRVRVGRGRAKRYYVRAVG